MGVLSQEPRKQCISSRYRSNRVMGFVARSVSNRSADVTLILKPYLVLVRLHLDYAVQFWSRTIKWI